jgi:hypothetical protein
MTIETKFNINDKVWFISPKNQKAVVSTISDVQVDSLYYNGIKYQFGSRVHPIDMLFINENNCFKTKEELIASL